MKKFLIMIFTSIFIIMFSIISFAGGFVQDNIGIRYDVGGGKYLKNGWAWVDITGTGLGYCYYFSPYGYVLVNDTTPDGFVVDTAGRWVSGGTPQTKLIPIFGYELETAYCPTYPDSQAAKKATVLENNDYLANRIISSNNVEITNFVYNNTNYPNSIEFTESFNPYIVFNSGLNTSLTFDVAGDYIPDEGDFVMEVYANGTRIERFSQRFVDLTTHTITFAADQYIEIRIPIINDYMETYLRKIYIFNAKLGSLFLL